MSQRERGRAGLCGLMPHMVVGGAWIGVYIERESVIHVVI